MTRATVVPLRRRRAPWLVLLGTAVAAVVLLALAGLGGATTYYLTPTELLARADSQHQDVRLAGLVLGSAAAAPASTARFRMTDGATTLTVLNDGSIPTMFEAGREVVVEGRLDGSGLFHAHRLLVKHSNSYRPLDGTMHTPPAGVNGT